MKLINKTIEYGLYLLVFILPWQTRWIILAGELNGGYWEYGTISLYASDILLVILLVFFVFLRIMEFQISNVKFPMSNKVQILNYKIQGYWWLIAGLELFIFISIFFAADKLLALFYYIRFLLGIGFFWLIIKANYNNFKLIFSFILGIFLQAVLGIWQFFAQSSFASKWLGMALHNSSDLGTSVVETLSGERWLRAYGGLDHPNMLGGFLVVGIVMLIYLILNNKKLNYELGIKKYRLEYFIFHILLLTFITALFFTFSRGAWIGAGVGIMSIFILALIQSDWLAQKKLLKIILIFGIFIFIASSIFSDLVSARTSSNLRLETKSNNERIQSYQTSWKIIKNHWLFGTGIGNYTLAVYDEVNKNQPSYFYQPTHNFFLLVFSEIGIFGFIFFVLLIVSILISNFLSRGWRKFKISQDFKKDSNFNYLNIALIISMFPIFLVDHWFWSLHFGILFFWLVIGLIFRLKDKN